MAAGAHISEYIHSLLHSDRMRHLVTHHQVFEEKPPRFTDIRGKWPAAIQNLLNQTGIRRLYSHQVEAIDLIRRRQHVVVATPTASGKTLIYNLPVLEHIESDPEFKALYLFPLKALAQDQLRAFCEMAAAFPDRWKPTAAIYDGDTTAWQRKKIRQTPPHVLMSNPEMLHLSILPHHDKWQGLLSRLKLVVVDEVHSYRGVMGSHMALVFRRLRRICDYYGVSPAFVFSSATIANPDELAGLLTGLKVQVIDKSGAPRGIRHLVIMNPDSGPAQTAILLLKAALHRGLRTIVYTQSRKMTELIAIWAGSQSGRFQNKISAYRAGFLPEERRAIEEKLSRGDLLAVISTSALELGIDIGDLDLCILVGYPGSIMATWQRGGRVGRSGQESALVLIAGEDALDQYFARNPAEFIQKPPEAAVINPFNPHVMEKHLVCAAAELPLKGGEPFLEEKKITETVERLHEKAELLQSAEGGVFFSRYKNPHRQVDLRGTGNRFVITCAETGESKGEIDGFRAFTETHPGAIYLHHGETHRVEELDLASHTVLVAAVNADYYTRARTSKNTEILSVDAEKTIRGTRIFLGRLKVTEQVTGYETWRIQAKKRLSIHPLDLPPQQFETEGLWFTIPPSVQQAVEDRYLHFMGGIHAIEHAAIGIFPFFVMTDRNDLGGISTPMHTQLNCAAVFIYDGIPGGAGLSRQAFVKAGEMLAQTYQCIRRCPCDNGCPSCVHSPKCGSGNRPIDKNSALFILEMIRSEQAPVFQERRPVWKKTLPAETKTGPQPRQSSRPLRYGVLDVETQRSAQEVGGWQNADLMGISGMVLYDSEKDDYFEYMEKDITEFVAHVTSLDLMVGFNIKRFDYRVISRHTSLDFHKLNTLDILEKIQQRLGYRLPLDHLADTTLGIRKTADGLQALLWWKQGRIREIMEYCRKDVEITRDLFLFGKQNGYLLFKNKAGKAVRLPVNW